MTKTVKTFVEVQADDIRKIGGTICEGDNGFTHFLCDTATANIEEILLRSILKCFGDDYRILATETFTGMMTISRLNLRQISRGHSIKSCI